MFQSTYTQESFDKMFREAIQHGYHECAKLIYPSTSPVVLQSFLLDQLGSKLNSKIFSSDRSVPILELLESYNSTLSFLLDIKYQSKFSSILTYLLPKLTQLDYNSWGNTQIFRELITNLVKLQDNIMDSSIVYGCMTRGSIGGLLILDEMNVLTPEALNNNIKYLNITPESQSIINLASKYINIDHQQATFIISHYIQSNVYACLHKNTADAKFQIIASIIKQNNWIITLEDDMLGGLIAHPFLIPYVLDIIADIHVTKCHIVTKSETYEKLILHIPNLIFDPNGMPELEWGSEWGDEEGGDGW